MKTGVLNHPGHKLIDEIRWTSENGFDFIDLTIEPPGAYEFDVKEIKLLLEHFNLEATGHTNPFLPFIMASSCLFHFFHSALTLQYFGFQISSNFLILATCLPPSNGVDSHASIIS